MFDRLKIAILLLGRVVGEKEERGRERRTGWLA